MENEENVEKKPFYKKKWFIIIIVVLVIGAIGGVTASIKLNQDINEAAECIARGDYAEAKELLDYQLNTNPSQKAIYLSYADYYLAQNLYLDAVNILEKGAKSASSKDEINEKLEEINTQYSAEIDQMRKEEESAQAAAKAAAAEAEKKAEEQKEEQKKQDEATYKNECQKISYEDLSRNPDNYKGTKIVFSGEVVQVIEGIFTNTYRVNVTQNSFGYYTDTVYVTYSLPDGSSRILEGDIITLYGEFGGIESYTSILGAKISIPRIDAVYVTIDD